MSDRTSTRGNQGDTYIHNYIFGDKISSKHTDTIRIGFQNFNGLTGRINDPVDDSLRSWITSQEFDVFGISEINLYWPKVNPSLQFHKCLTRWWAPGQTRGIFAYNSTEKRKKRSIRQYGGTAQICRHEAVIREQKRGADPRGLGRWVWQEFRGKKGKSLVVITAYRPNASTGPFTVHSQQVEYYNEIKMSCNPRQQMLDDLQLAIVQWKEEGHQIVLQMDCNEDVRSTAFQRFLQTTGLRDSILHRHGTNAPATYIDGSNPIDGIFVTPAIEISIRRVLQF